METNMKNNVLWNTTGSVFYSACQWGITVLVIYLSTFKDAGILSLAMTTSSSFSAISLFSMRNYQISDISNKYSSNIYVGSRILTCILAYVTCIIAAGLISGNSIQFGCTVAFMIIRLAEALVDVLHGINQKYEKYDIIGKSYFLRGTITIATFCIGMLYFNNLFISLLIMGILNLFLALSYDWLKTNTLEKITPQIDNSVFRLLKDCLPIVVFTFLLSLINLIPKMILEDILGTAALGVYSTIATPTLVVQVLASVIFLPFLPKLTMLYHNEEYYRFNNIFNKTLVYLVILGVFSILGSLLAGEYLLELLFGNKIVEYSYLLIPIVWCTILLAAIWILSSVVIAIRKTKALLIGMLIDTTLMLAIVYPLIREYGQNGASYAQIIPQCLYIAYLIIAVKVTINKQYLYKNQKED